MRMTLGQAAVRFLLSVAFSVAIIVFTGFMIWVFWNLH
mgnify:CR=1 FL=1